jgi:uncharacterized protein YcbX
VANQASLDWLADRTSDAFGMDRFRANLVVAGAAAWDEDTWRGFTIGAAQLGLGVPWPRCTIPQIDQVSGERHAEPARILKRYRWCLPGSVSEPAIAAIIEGKALFGLACSIVPEGTGLVVGDAVMVDHRDAPHIAPPQD